MTQGHVSVSHWTCCMPFNSSKTWPAQTPMIVFLSCTPVKIWQALPCEICTQNIFSGWMEAKPLLPPLSTSFCLFLFCLFIFTWYFSWPFPSIFKILKCPLKWSQHPLGGKHTTALFFFEALLKNNPLLSSGSQNSVICTYNLIL